MTTTATSSSSSVAINSGTGALIASSLALSIRYAEDLIQTIPADRFCEMPTKDMNHPAFCVGHLAIYANRVLEMIGRADLKIDMPFGDEHFKNGAPCVAQDGRYPSKDVICDTFFKGWRTVLAALPSADDAAFRRENPAEGRFKEMFPTVGGAVNFLAGGHNMMHLGQISTWRRSAGLGSAH
jgi:hypothetical protein